MLVRHAAALAAVLAVACCAPAPDEEPTPVLVASADLRLPLDEYLLSPGQLRELGRARVAMTRECMRGAGFDFPPAEERVDVGLTSWNERRYGITDEALAAVDGYGLGARDPAARPSTPRPEPTPEQRAALEGADGCIERVEAGQGRDEPSGVDRELPLRLANESFTRSRGAPRVRAVVEAWSECVRARGFDSTDPLALASDDRFAGPVTPAEVAAATADVECKRSTNLVGTWFAEERSIQRDLVAANRAALASVREANAADVDRARRALGP
ncbi:hypothetical protein ACFFQW_00020 [Umezawaea endophytica]|uniref:PknH-like protein n=1 Tax=Umezawaea endophytica TaxID=1654476 RepID=A0A9X2VFW9_9PSEU|nr:hypothetical protein [Umezawaea endophytica]MCS7475881.1 hypothetical protein [Umezawaea endophytica]